MNRDAQDERATRYGLICVVALVVLAGIALFVLTGCSDPGKAEVDLPEDKITTQLGATDVIVNADNFPNFAHTCWGDGDIPVGFWSTTDRVTIIVYNDWLCPGSSAERPMTVLTGTPQAVVGGT